MSDERINQFTPLVEAMNRQLYQLTRIADSLATLTDDIEQISAELGTLNDNLVDGTEGRQYVSLSDTIASAANMLHQ